MGVSGGSEKRDKFFDLAPDDVEAWIPPSSVPYRKKRINLKPLLAALCTAVLLSGIIIGVIFLIPSSTVIVPDINRLDISSAMEKVRETGLKPKVTGWVYDPTLDEGIAVSQKPEAGKRVKKGSVVLIVASKGGKERDGLEELPDLSEQTTSLGTGAARRRKICIDPGKQGKPGSPHGDWVDPGMSRRALPEESLNGVTTGNPEHLLNLDISIRVKNLLTKEGFDVIMTRETGAVEIGGIDRAEIASKSGADLLISIQMSSSSDPNQKGCIIFYPERNSWTEPIYWGSKKAALLIGAEFSRYSAIKPVSVTKTGLFSIFNWSSVPAVCIRVGFITNPHDDTLLGEEAYRTKVARLVVSGVRKYFLTP